MKENTTKSTLNHWYSFRLLLLFEGIIIGLVAGLIVVAYRILIEKSMKLLSSIYVFLSDSPVFIFPWILLLIALGLILGRMVKAQPLISGSGIPQIEGILMSRISSSWSRVLPLKFIGGILASSAGLSLGREGPSIQLGATVGQGFCKIFKRHSNEERYLITGGASAGLAAAFNAPLAGVLFALEEVHKHFSPLVLLTALASALSATYVSGFIFGLKPIFSFSVVQAIPLEKYGYVIVLGILAGFFGFLFNRSLLSTQLGYSSQKIIAKKYWIIIPLLCSIPIGIFFPDLLGGGHDLIEKLSHQSHTMQVLILFLIIKFFYTMISYGSSAPGGIFLPLLALGAIVGSLYGVTVSRFFGLDEQWVQNFIILSMAATFTAITRAPITGIVLLTEMTGSFSHLLTVALVSIVAYTVADVLGSKPIYEALLSNLLANKVSLKRKRDNPKKTLLEFSVCSDSICSGKKIKDILWPETCLLVGLQRNGEELLPKGDTILMSGDFLVVLTNENDAGNVCEIVMEHTGLCIIE